MSRRIIILIAIASCGLLAGEMLAIRAIEMFAPVGVMLTGAILTFALGGAAVGALIAGRAPSGSGSSLRLAALALSLLLAFVPLWGVFLCEAFAIGPLSSPLLLLVVAALAVGPLAIASGTIFPLGVGAGIKVSGGHIGLAASAGALGAAIGALAPELLDIISDRSLALGIAVALALSAVAVGGRRSTTIAVIAILICSPLFIPRLPHDCDTSTRYYACLAIVYPHADEPTLTQLNIGRSGVISIFYLNSSTPARIYIGAARDLARLRVAPGSGRIATLGGGGLGFPRLWAGSGSGVVTPQVAVEIDAKMLELVESVAPSSLIPGLEVVAGDARRWVTTQPDNSYRLVFVDTFRTAEPAPGMLSHELAADLSRITTGDGLVIYHAAGWGSHRIPRAVAATLKSAFPWVTAIRILQPGARPGDVNHTKWLIAASREPIDSAAIESIRPAIDGWQIEQHRSDAPGWDDFVGDATVLSDDFAPLEWLNLLDTLELISARGQ